MVIGDIYPAYNPGLSMSNLPVLAVEYTSGDEHPPRGRICHASSSSEYHINIYARTGAQNKALNHSAGF